MLEDPSLFQVNSSSPGNTIRSSEDWIAQIRDHVSDEGRKVGKTGSKPRSINFITKLGKVLLLR